MIPDIGMIVAFYVMTRCLSIAFVHTEPFIAKVAAWITMAVTIVCTIAMYETSGYISTP